MTAAGFTLAYGCVLVAALLPIVCAGIAKYGALRTPPGQGGYDNSQPRAWLARQSDWRARANAAQANTFEALPFFFAAVIIAHQLQASQGRLDLLALLFVALRIAYIALYVGDRASARSLVWALAFFVNIAILFTGFRRPRPALARPAAASGPVGENPHGMIPMRCVLAADRLKTR